MQNYTATATTSLIISAERACTGTISNPYTGWSTSFTISANGRIDVSVPYSQCYVTSYGSVVNAGCHIVATDIISVYAMNYYTNTFDGSNILPTPTLGDEYVLQTYPGNLYGSEFMILATEDNTIVDITPTSATSNSWYAGSTYSITLNSGQCYQGIFQVHVVQHVIVREL